jgi:hypothetical protein
MPTLALMESDRGQTMDQPDATPRERNLLQRLLVKIEDWARGSEIDHMSADDVRQLAHDVGLDPSEFARLAGGGSDDSRLLYARLQSLGLTMAEIEAAGVGMARDMERTCGLCADRTLCEHDLTERPDATEWRRICPNQWVFDEMERLKKVQS